MRTPAYDYSNVKTRGKQMAVSVFSDNDKVQIHALRQHFTDRIKAYSDSQVLFAWRSFVEAKHVGSYMTHILMSPIEPRTSVEDNIIYNLRSELGDEIKAFSDRQVITAYEMFCVSSDFPDVRRFVDLYFSTEGIDNDDDGGGNKE